MKDPSEVIIKPHVSEKSLFSIEEDNRYTFVVAGDANKMEIKRAIEELFEVQVENVNTDNRPGRWKSMGVHRGKTPNWKRAIIRLAEGDRIEIFEGM